MHAVIDQQLRDFLKTAGFTGNLEFGTPPKPEMGDVAIPCFELAKEQKKSPVEVAKQIQAQIENQTSPIIEKIQAAGPYVNLFLKTSKVAEIIIEEVLRTKDNYGTSNLGNGKKVLIEYPSQNTHKEFHIGHLRNVCIGNTLVQLYRKSGYGIIPVNYVNDFGAHVVKCLWGLKKFHATESAPENKQKWLGLIYAEASNYSKDHPEVQPELDELQKKLEAHDPEIWPLFQETRQWSNEGFGKLLTELAVDYSHVFYESEVKERGQAIVDDLLQKGIATIGERGAVIIDLSEYKLDIALVRKATGAGLYITSDLALAEKKFSTFPVEESINITGIEQNFYFKQLFKVLELFGFKNKMTHIGYGLVNLPEGKMSSRNGTVILYEDLRDEIYNQLYQGSKERHADWSEEKLHETVWKLTMAVIKFTMQKHEAIKNIAFDMKEAVSFEGYSAPYILYVVARINSILRKAKDYDASLVQSSYDRITEPTEKKILFLLGGNQEMLSKALAAYNPSVVAKYCFDVAQAFSEWYTTCSIISGDKEITQARLGLAVAVKTVLVEALKILTIDVVEEM
jgi:arginyl-tRNA synthetase